MSDQNPAGQGGSPGGTASPGANTAGQSASANTGLTLEAIQSAMQAVIAPLQAKITSLENQANAARRVSQKDEQKPNRIDPSALPENIRPVFVEQQERLDRMERAEADRVANEQKTARQRALEAQIAKGGYANPKLMRDLIDTRLRQGATGEIVYDHDGRTLSLEQAVQDIGSQDVFRPAPGGNGVGASPSTQQGAADAPKPMSQAQIAAMADADVLKLAQRVMNGEKVAFGD